MTFSPSQDASIGVRPAAEPSIGRVAAVNGATATIELTARNYASDNPTVGKFVGIVTPKALIIGLVTEVGEQALTAAAAAGARASAKSPVST